MDLFLSNFHTIQPAYMVRQADALKWLISAHLQAEATLNGWESSSEKWCQFQKEISTKFQKVACKPGSIDTRGGSISDFLHTEWDKMRIYRLDAHPRGVELEKRTDVFVETSNDIFTRFYQDEQTPPSDLIHVTCTGYASPSPAQKLLSLKNWGKYTQITHAYHMGCYGAIPAIRMGQGYMQSDHTKNVNIVHTELCTLHTNPLLHDFPQIVAQSLFADGFIKYSLGEHQSPRLQILATHQEIIDGTEKAMIWDVSQWGFRIHLAKEIPVFIARSLKDYLENLLKKASIKFSDACNNCLFAIHPGGPKIIQNIQNTLHLEEQQIKHSMEILQRHGNMSSATLPHIWKAMLEDDNISNDSVIVSIAFGPGLSISGCVLKKE